MKFFKKQKVENSLDIENTMVELEKSKKQLTIAEALKDADTLHNMSGYCNMDHMVKINDTEEMAVKDLVSKYNAMVEKSKKDEEAAEGEGAAMDDEFANEEEEAPAEEEAEGDAQLDNAADEEEEGVELSNAEKALLKKIQAKRALKNAADKKAAEKARRSTGMSHFKNLSNAADRAELRKIREEESNFDSERSQLARGQERYGSAKK